MAYPGSDVTSRLQMPSSSTRPDPDAALVPQLGSDLSPATLRRVARLERADSPRTAASSAPADGAVSRQWNPVARCARHHSPKGSPGQPASASQGRRRERLSFPHRTGEPLRDELAWAGLAPSGGSSGGADTVTSHVFEAVGIPITGSLRFWVHPGTSAADVERLRAVLPGIVERLGTDAAAGAR